MRLDLRCPCAALTALLASPAAASDGAYGRLDGDAMASVELGASYTAAPPLVRGPSLAARAGLSYLQTVGLVFQYDDRLGSADAVARTFAGGVEIRPLFLGRFTQDMERGPAHLDLLVDSLGLSVGAWTQWQREPHCAGDCTSHGMEVGVGFEIPFLPRASTPYLGVHGAVRWTLSNLDAASPAPPPVGIFTLTLGYRHLFAIHLVDASDHIDD